MFEEKNKLLYLSLGTIFSILFLLVVGVENQTTDQRSQARGMETIYKKWEFNGRSSEGWSANSLEKVEVQNGFLWAAVSAKNKNPHLKKEDVNTTLPPGDKKFKIRMAVNSPTLEKTLGTQDQKNGSLETTPIKSDFLFTIYYKKADKGNWEKPVTIAGPVDGQLHEYIVDFSNKEIVKFDQLILQFTKGPVGGYRVQIDWIGLAGMISGQITSQQPSIVACTQDAKLCPDGSSVGRVPPKCEFAPCPTKKAVQ